MAAIRAIQDDGTGTSSFAGWVRNSRRFLRPQMGRERRARWQSHSTVLTTLAVGILPFDSPQASVELMERDALDSMSDAVLAIAAERSVEPVLQRLVHAARELAGARYAALGIPDGEGAFAQFLTAGMSDELIARDGAAAADARPARRDARVTRAFRTADIHARPALPRLVAGRAPRHALVPRRADRRARRA